MTESTDEAPKSPRLWQRNGFGPAVVAAAAAAMLVWTWGTWADLLVDFGVQLYVPWRLVAGQVLYRDIAHYTGPLSIYYNAAACKILGVSLRTIVLVNLPVLAGIIAAIYFLALKLAGKIAAAAAGLSFVFLFAFAHLTRYGNYNYVCPYEYEYTHAMLLCLLCLIFLRRIEQGNRRNDAWIAGLLAGLVFLTRAEYFTAIIVAAEVSFILSSLQNGRLSWGTHLRFYGGVIILAAISVGLLSLEMPARTALAGSLGMWRFLGRSTVTSQFFYVHSMGLDVPGNNLRLMSIVFGFYALSILIFSIWAVAARRRATAIQAIGALILGAAMIGIFWRSIDWLSLFRPLPVVGLIVIFIALKPAMEKSDSPRRRTASFTIVFAVFSLILLIKVFFYARIFQYGCWLAMPATMLLVIAVFGWIGDAIGRKGGNATVYLAGVGGVWAAVIVMHLSITGKQVNLGNEVAGTGADAMAANQKAKIVNPAIELAKQIVRPDQTLTCFPEGIMINYLARRRTSTRYVNFNPPDLLLFGEQNMCDALAQSPPDYILMVDKDTREFGVRFFGKDYGQKIFGWIAANYHEVEIPQIDLGPEPMSGDGFGIRLWVPDSKAKGVTGPDGR